MTGLDRFLQRWRVRVAAAHIPDGGRVLDVGSADGALFAHLGARLGTGVGIDPVPGPAGPGVAMIRGTFPADLPELEPFDAITMLAVVEHVPMDRLPEWASAAATLLIRGGRLIITTPSPLVDPILDGLRRVRLIEGMALEEHYGFDPREVPDLFRSPGLDLTRRRRFQLGLNNLFVFTKP